MKMQNSRRRRRYVWMVASAAVASSIIAWLPSSVAQPQSPSSAASTAVPVDSTASKAASDQTTLAGKAIVVENALLKIIESPHLAAEVSGRLERLDVSEGSRITAGQALGRISDGGIQLKTERARIALDMARKKQLSEIDLSLAVKKHEVAENELQRALTANKRAPNTYNPKEVDRFKLLAESTQLEIERAKHERELAALEVSLAENEFQQSKELLARHRLRSPVSGMVVAISKRVGEWVEPGTELMQIVNSERLRVEGFVRAEDAAKNLMRRPVTATVNVGEVETTVQGFVAFVSPDVNSLNGLVRVFLEIDNAKGQLRPGTPTKATIDLTRPPLEVEERGSAAAAVGLR